MPGSKATSISNRRRSLTPTFRFVGGKGGVGKTTCAAALGLLAARAGQRTLIVSTDPAPSLGDALQQPLGRLPRKVRGVARLEAVEVDATDALAAWLEDRRGLLETIALRGTWLDADDVARLLRLSLPGIDEIAGLLQLADFAASGRYEHIVVDTAPTGHLLRMIALPAVLEGLAEVFDRMQGKHRIMVDALRGAWTPDAADVLIQGVDEQARWLGALLRDPERCRVSWVTLPEDMAIRETDDGLRALAEEQITVDRVIVNRMTPPPRRPCGWCDGRRRLEGTALRPLRRRLRGSGVTIASVPAIAAEPRGPRALAAVTRHLSAESAVHAPPPAGRRRRLVAPLAATTQIVERSALVPAGTALVLFGGKGGVGKTTCAAALAIDTALTSTDRRVLLLSADPAHSLGDVLQEDVADDPRPIQGGPANLSVRELDPSRGFAVLRDRFARGIEELMLRIGGSAGDRQVLHDLLELAPPGVDELVAIVEVIETLDADAGRATFDLIVIDTAPTGHALRLLEMPALVHDWVKAVMSILLKYQPMIGVGDLGAALLRLSRGLGQLRALLTNAARTRFLVVTRAAALPRAETVRLLARVDAAGLAAPIVVVNAVGAGTCPRCRSEDGREYKEISALARALPGVRGARRSLILAPAMLPPPAGGRDLRSFFRLWRQLPQSRR
jgi:arsenite/tail-anchored protein-transporting ATPase